MSAPKEAKGLDALADRWKRDGQEYQDYGFPNGNLSGLCFKHASDLRTALAALRAVPDARPIQMCAGCHRPVGPACNGGCPAGTYITDGAVPNSQVDIPKFLNEDHRAFLTKEPRWPNDAESVVIWWETFVRPTLTRVPDSQNETERLQGIIERDRSGVASALTAIRKALHRHEWMREGRGSYEWNDDRFHEEFGRAWDAVWNASDPLERIAADWTDCPKTQAGVEEARRSQNETEGAAVPELDLEAIRKKLAFQVANPAFIAHQLIAEVERLRRSPLSIRDEVATGPLPFVQVGITHALGVCERALAEIDWLIQELGGLDDVVDHDARNGLAALAAALRHDSAVPESRPSVPEVATGWRPIESAPKDGTEVLAWSGAPWDDKPYPAQFKDGAWYDEDAKRRLVEPAYQPKLWISMPALPAPPGATPRAETEKEPHA